MMHVHSLGRAARYFPERPAAVGSEVEHSTFESSTIVSPLSRRRLADMDFAAATGSPCSSPTNPSTSSSYMPAAAHVALADGSDYGGSLRNPAGWNNVFGFSHQLWTRAGRRTRCLAAFDGRAGPEWREMFPILRCCSLCNPAMTIVSALHGRKSGDILRYRWKPISKGKRIAWLGDFDGYLPYEPGVLDICKRSLDVFRTARLHRRRSAAGLSGRQGLARMAHAAGVAKRRHASRLL